jgi:hypothetical protein
VDSDIRVDRSLERKCRATIWRRVRVFRFFSLEAVHFQPSEALLCNKHTLITQLTPACKNSKPLKIYDNCEPLRYPRCCETQNVSIDQIVPFDIGYLSCGVPGVFKRSQLTQRTRVSHSGLSQCDRVTVALCLSSVLFHPLDTTL